MIKFIKNWGNKISLLVITIMLLFPTNLLQISANDGTVSSSSEELSTYTVGDYAAPSYGQISAVKFVKVVNGYLGGSALDASGSVWSWEYNAYGQTGVRQYSDGTPLAITNYINGYLGGMRRIEFFSEKNIKIIQIDGGYQTRVALSDTGEVYTWGRGHYGEMGNMDQETQRLLVKTTRFQLR